MKEGRISRKDLPSYRASVSVPLKPLFAVVTAQCKRKGSQLFAAFSAVVVNEVR